MIRFDMKDFGVIRVFGFSRFFVMLLFPLLCILILHVDCFPIKWLRSFSSGLKLRIYDFPIFNLEETQVKMSNKIFAEQQQTKIEMNLERSTKNAVLQKNKV